MMFPLDAGRGASAPPSTRSRGNCNFLQNKPFTNPSRPIPVVTLDIALSKHDRSTQVCINLGFQRRFARMTEIFFDDDNDGCNDNYDDNFGNFDDDYDKND